MSLGNARFEVLQDEMPDRRSFKRHSKHPLSERLSQRIILCLSQRILKIRCPKQRLLVPVSKNQSLTSAYRARVSSESKQRSCNYSSYQTWSRVDRAHGILKIRPERRSEMDGIDCTDSQSGKSNMNWCTSISNKVHTRAVLPLHICFGSATQPFRCPREHLSQATE